MINQKKLEELCHLIRYDILTSTTAAGSGHPTSSLSAVELTTTLFFAGFLKENDKFILSKGHASPLLYSLYHAAGAITYEELLTLRKFDSPLEGHPTPRFKYVDVATGSLGQGLSIGVGMALGMKLDQHRATGGTGGRAPDSAQRSEHWREGNPGQNLLRDPKVFVLLGDSEMAEGQVWEAMEIASYYKLDNLIAIVDVNRLGQRGDTMLGWSIEKYAERARSFGWETIVVEDGHDLNQVVASFKRLNVRTLERPTIIIAKTIKGKGVSFLEDKNGWHGKALDKDQLQQALNELGIQKSGDIFFELFKEPDDFGRGVPINPFDKLRVNPECNRRIKVRKTISSFFNQPNGRGKMTDRIYRQNEMVATREAYGDALVALGEANPNIVVLDAEVSNSTYSDKFGKKFPNRFFEMFIAEQNMVSAGLGLSKTGYIPFVSSFAAFLTRSFDQIRMSQYSNPNLKIVGSHSGVSIGPDGPSQMGLEDIAMMRSIKDSVVFYPSDAVSSFKLTQLMAQNPGIFYLRTTREKTPVIYKDSEKFKIGGSKILCQSPKDIAAIIGAGITVHEALKAYEELKKEQIYITVVDLYSIKPIDEKTLKTLANKNFIVVEDHYPYGGIGEAVLSALNSQSVIRNLKIINLSVNKTPRSGTPEELLNYEEISSDAIIKSVKKLL